MILVIGGAASGKSEYAEELILQNCVNKRVYLATMRPWDQECCIRIEKHRAMRAQKHFQTVECFENLASACVEQGADVLLECMSNLVANEMFAAEEPAPFEEVCQSVLHGVSVLQKYAANLIIVSNSVFADGAEYDVPTQAYLKALAKINTELAAQAETVVEVVCGIPVVWKGSDPLCACPQRL